MTFIICWGFAERQILKKWNWPYLLNWVEYFDRLPRKHWYLAQEIAKCHFLSVEVLPSSKFWKKWKWPYLLNWVEYCDEILHTHWYWQDVPHKTVKWHLRLFEFLPRFKFWKKCDYCKMTFIICWGFAELQILKKWNWPYLLNWVEYFDRVPRKHWYLAQEIAKCHFLSVEVLPSSKFWKSENGPISWTEWNSGWNFAYTLVLTRCSPWDCKMTFGIGEGFTEVQILKKVKLNS